MRKIRKPGWKPATQLLVIPSIVILVDHHVMTAMEVAFPPLVFPVCLHWNYHLPITIAVDQLKIRSCIPSPDIQSFLGPPPSLQSELKSFKIVGDNLDKHVQPRDMRSDYQARSLHFFHSYAVQDRIQSESCSESVPPIDPANVNFS